MKATLVTTAEVDDYGARLQSMEDALATHAEASFATAHRTITASASSLYTNADGVALGDHVLVIKLGDQVLYLPCRVVVGDVPAS